MGRSIKKAHGTKDLRRALLLEAVRKELFGLDLPKSLGIRSMPGAPLCASPV